MAGREKTWAVLAVVSGLAAAGCNGFGTNCSTDTDCQAQNPASVCDPTLKVCFVYSGPAVTSISPTNGATGVVAAGASVVATFSEPIVDAGVNFNTFLVTGQGFQTPGAYSFNAGNTQATFEPYGGTLALGTDYTVSLTSVIQDPSGNALLPFSSAFSTADGAWQAGAQFRPGPSVGEFSLASNYFGNLVATVDVALDDDVSIDDFGLTGGVSGAGDPPNLPFTPNVQDSTGQMVFLPVAGSASDGTGLVAWNTQSTDAGAPVAYDALAAVYLPSGSGWTQQTFLESNSPKPPLPQIVGMGIGEALVAWLHTDPTGKQVVVAEYYDVGVGWNGFGSIQEDRLLNASQMVLAGNILGNAVAAWVSESTPDAGPLQIYAEYLPQESTTPVPLATPGLTAQSPAASIGILNSGAVVWMAGSEPSDGGAEVFHIYASTLDPKQATVFSSPVQIDAAPGTAEFPQVGVAANGDAVAIWHEFSSTTGVNAVVSSVYTYATKSWSAPVTVDSSASTGAAEYAPALAVDPGGNALAAWFEGSEASHQVVGGRYTADAGWHGIEQLTSGSDVVDNLQLQIVIDGFGRGWEAHQRHTAGFQYYIEFIPFQ